MRLGGERLLSDRETENNNIRMGAFVGNSFHTRQNSMSRQPVFSQAASIRHLNDAINASTKNASRIASQRSFHGPMGPNSGKILPKSQELLTKTFGKEFWPQVQHVLQ